MPNRRTFELIIIVSILAQPAFALVRTWAHKHMATTSNESTGVGASVAAELF